MKKSILQILRILLILLFSGNLVAQDKKTVYNQSTDFWNHVQFGGGIGVSIGSGYTDISLAPSAIYNVNEILSLGVGLQGGIISARNSYKSYTYGGSLIGLINPIQNVQLSVELEELGVSTKYSYPTISTAQFWNTALYLGAGYKTGNVTIGARYDVLFDPDKRIYNSAFMPFVRVYF